MVQRAVLKRLRKKLFQLRTEARTLVVPRVKTTSVDGGALANALEEQSAMLAQRVDLLEEIVMAMLDD
jgi:hypothetical protein